MQAKAYSYIRFSTPDQAKGDSLRRQLEASREYAKKKGLELDDSLSLRDLGLSAYKGHHKTKGALGEFIRLVEAGNIPKGSLLIVENIDRLSREKVLDALAQFSSLINAGIRVVTLQDGMEYTKESIDQNWTQLIISITYMARAHDESAIKSRRIKEAWKHKRQDRTEGKDNKAFTARCPTWLKLSKEDRTEFIMIPDACKAIEAIFRKKLSGIGNESIAYQMNTSPDFWKPPLNNRNKTGGWRKSYVTKILSNKAVIGEFQPHKMVMDFVKDKQVRVPDGPPIPDYFPAIIDKNLFYAVQDQIARNREQNGFAGGRTGKATNLFAHVVKCGVCKGPMHFINKGKPPKGGQYLHCDRSRRNLYCHAKAVRYDEFEKLFFNNFEELNIKDLLPGQDEAQAQINDLERRLDSIAAQSRDLSDQENNLIDSIATTQDARVREILEKRLARLLDEKVALSKENKDIQTAVEDLRQAEKSFTGLVEQGREIHSLLDSAHDELERINLRTRLRTQVRKLVEQIEIYPLVVPYQAQLEIEPGIVKWMNSKFIEKVRIKFKGSRKKRLLLLSGKIDTQGIE